MHASCANTFPIQPDIALSQDCGYCIEDKHIVISVANIANHRGYDNLSGTLSLELWALRQPYGGGHFEGICVAGDRIGELSGQHEFNGLQVQVDFHEPPAGHWHLTLMLREWTMQGFETRDYVNFGIPFITHWSPTIVQGKLDGKPQSKGESQHDQTVIPVDFVETEKRLEISHTPIQQDHAQPNNADPSRGSEAETKAKKRSKKAVGKKDNKKTGANIKISVGKKRQFDQVVNLNEADIKRVAELKGVSNKLAQAIVDARPFTRLEDLLNVKGMGNNLLNNLRDQIEL